MSSASCFLQSFYENKPFVVRVYSSPNYSTIHATINVYTIAVTYGGIAIIMDTVDWTCYHGCLYMYPFLAHGHHAHFSMIDPDQLIDWPLQQFIHTLLDRKGHIHYLFFLNINYYFF